ncbi:MAG: hypothetical protein A2293_11020 [Elusimicrobia bacterium RIFOXYB2_FULL_49_7]|nr:MAG: hypothetical protein A2293_11020 [Elusimicrobia bacterium RIFOXYB2_FULL_49_7]
MRPDNAATDTQRLFTILERVLFLKEVDLFRNVDTEKLSMIAEIAREMRVEAGELLCRQGEPSECLFIIKQGGLRVMKEKGGVRYTLKNILSGQWYGIYGLFGSGRQTPEIVANEPTVLYEIRKNEFRKVLLSNPEMAYNLLEILSERLGEMDDEILLLNKTLTEVFKASPTMPGDVISEPSLPNPA